MKHSMLIIAGAALLVGCGEADTAEVAVEESGEGATPEASASAAGDIVELPYGMTSYPGATDFDRWDTSNNGKVGAQISMFTTDDPITVAQYYADQSRDLGMEVTGPNEQFDSYVVSANRPDGKTAHYSTFERRGDRTRVNLGFASLEDQ